MIECKNCGKMNFSNASNCTECKEPLPIVPEQTHATPVHKAGMHWFWAFLIMVGIKWIGGQICTAFVPNSLHALYTTPLNFVFTNAVIMRDVTMSHSTNRRILVRSSI